jgi:hypothetical protein
MLSACLRVAASAKAGIGHGVILDPKLKAESRKLKAESKKLLAYRSKLRTGVIYNALQTSTIEWAIHACTPECGVSARRHESPLHSSSLSILQPHQILLDYFRK